MKGAVTVAKSGAKVSATKAGAKADGHTDHAH